MRSSLSKSQSTQTQTATAEAGSGELASTSLPIPELESFEPSVDQSLFSNLDGVSLASLKSTVGDLYLLVNESTLGLSEEDICFHVRHAATKIMAEEREARKQLLSNNKYILEDRVGRARGIAAGARLLGFVEGLQLLSAIRLGVDLRLLDRLQPHELNTLMLQSQGAQLEIACGQACDAYRLNMERAALFRSRFSMGLER